MCVAIPSRVVALEGDMATVECFGRERQVSLMLMNEPVAIGDFLAVQSGAFAVDRIDPAEAAEALRYFAEVMGAEADEDR